VGLFGSSALNLGRGELDDCGEVELARPRPSSDESDFLEGRRASSGYGRGAEGGLDVGAGCGGCDDAGVGDVVPALLILKGLTVGISVSGGGTSGSVMNISSASRPCLRPPSMGTSWSFGADVNAILQLRAGLLAARQANVSKLTVDAANSEEGRKYGSSVGVAKKGNEEHGKVRSL